MATSSVRGSARETKLFRKEGFDGTTLYTKFTETYYKSNIENCIFNEKFV